ncbi:Golgi transport complex subunit 1 [Gaertneriomyces sp. JEL0708]|nr:Golgi transport complex subunit 1 [Gaertneriomyces sp. JEL0708]
MERIPTSPAIQYNPAIGLENADADELLERSSVAEVKIQHARLAAEIDRKKHDLRSMVGERYRDLIDAADSIRDMHHLAASVNQAFVQMQECCDSSALMRRVEVTQQRGRDSATERLKSSLYSAGAQLKLLLDTPEQVWRSLEGHCYLKASRLYLIAQRVYENLHAKSSGSESAHLRPATPFPVIKRQWNAVRHLRPQILERAIRHLRSSKRSTHEVAETICAILILSDMTIQDILTKLLDARTETMIAAISVESFDSDADKIGESICEALDELRVTLRSLATLFLRDPKTGTPSMYEKVLQAVLDVPEATQEGNMRGTIAGLYSEKTNIHIILRHLPSSVRRHAPHVPNERKALLPGAVQHSVSSWLDEVTRLLRSNVEIVLKAIEKGDDLARVRSTVVRFVSNTEYPSSVVDHKRSVLRHSEAEPWDALCRRLLSRPFCLWKDIARQSMNMRAEKMLQSVTEHLSCQPREYLKPKLAKLSENSIPDRHMSSFIWDMEMRFPDALVPMDEGGGAASFAVTPMIREFHNMFQSTLDGLQRELRRISHGLRVQPKDDSIESANDLWLLMNTYERLLVQAILSYRDGLLAVLREMQEQACETEEQEAIMVDQCLVVGRIALTVSETLRDGSISSIFDTSYVTVQEEDERMRSLQQSLASKLLNAQHQLLEVYDAAHGVWIELISRRLQSSLLDELRSTDWTAHSSETVRAEGAANLPIKTSSFVSRKLFELCTEWNRVAAFTLAQMSLEKLSHRAAESILTAYSTFVSHDLKAKAISTEGALQLAFDFSYLLRVLGKTLPRGATTSSEMIETLISMARLDYPQAQELLEGNVEGVYSRTSLMLGPFGFTPGKTPSSKKTGTGDVQSVLLPTVNQHPPRFTLLPVVGQVGRNRHPDSRYSISMERRTSLIMLPEVPQISTFQRKKPSIKLFTNRQQRQPKRQEKPLAGGAGTSVLGLVSSLPLPVSHGQVQQKTSELLSSATSFLSGVLDLTHVASPTMAKKPPSAKRTR